MTPVPTDPVENLRSILADLGQHGPSDASAALRGYDFTVGDLALVLNEVDRARGVLGQVTAMRDQTIYPTLSGDMGADDAFRLGATTAFSVAAGIARTALVRKRLTPEGISRTREIAAPVVEDRHP